MRLAAFLGFASLVALSATATALAGPPGSSPDNPITAVGRPGPPDTSFVVIRWPDGATETVEKPGVASQALLETTIEERAIAEGRKPVTPKPSSNTSTNTRTLAATRGIKRQALGSSYGASACSGQFYPPYKLTSSSVATSAWVTCTVDVNNVFGTIYLFRSANWTLIGLSSTSNNGPGAVWETEGSCLSSTWQYNASISWGFTGANGTVFAPVSYAGPSWISC